MVFAGGADFVFLFGKTDADIGADEPFHVVACVRSNKSVFDEANGNGQVGADNQLALTGIALQHVCLRGRLSADGYGKLDPCPCKYVPVLRRFCRYAGSG